MTNNEIIKKLMPNFESYPLMTKQEGSNCMNEARADEREKVIREIEKWVDNNHDINDRYFKTVALELLTTKLNSLREAK